MSSAAALALALRRGMLQDLFYPIAFIYHMFCVYEDLHELGMNKLIL